MSPWADILARVDADLRETPAYREVEAFFRRVLEPGFGTPANPGDPRVAPDGRLIAFRAEVLRELEGHPRARICLIEAGGGEVRTVEAGDHDDDQPRWSPDGSVLSFRSDRAIAGRHALWALDSPRFAEPRPLPEAPGVVEEHAWSADGTMILAVVAGMGAERSDAVGSGTVGGRGEAPPWLPEVETSAEDDDTRRRLFLVDPSAGTATAVSPPALNVWEAAWCGSRRVAAIVSDGGGEADWYGARLSAIDLDTGDETVLLRTDVQLGWVAAAPSGNVVAVVEARCSDRLVVAGELVLVDPRDGAARRVDAGDVDIGWLSWDTDDRLVAIGVRGLDSVLLDVDPASGTATERWSGSEFTGSSLFLGGAALDAGAVLPLQSHARPPSLVRVEAGSITTLVPGKHAGTHVVRSTISERRPISWNAPDGLRIEGLLTLPRGGGPFPLIVQVHGGPVWGFQDFWPSPLRALWYDRGYATLEPNPRGSWGRGRAFVDPVIGDMGGADAHDVLAGVDHVVALGVADPTRLGVTGGSYGGFMACWLPTVDGRFAAAVAMSPVSDWFSERFESNLGRWNTEFLGGDVPDRWEHYRERSPVFAGTRLRTPTLLTAGTKDRATPPGQAVEFHRVLTEAGIPTEVAQYPLEGHGVRDLPAAIDAATRIIGWFERFMPPGPPR
jgi:dipeptidyl aminopeptidase/acylaminoacyl peptidase